MNEEKEKIEVPNIEKDGITLDKDLEESSKYEIEDTKEPENEK